MGEMVVVGGSSSVRRSSAGTLHIRIANILHIEKAKILVILLLALLLVQSIASAQFWPPPIIIIREKSDSERGISTAYSTKDKMIFAVSVADAYLYLNKSLKIIIKQPSCSVSLYAYASRYFIYGDSQLLLFDKLQLLTATDAQVEIYKIKATLNNNTIQDIYAFKTNCEGGWRVYIEDTTEIVGAVLYAIDESKVEKEEVGKSISRDPLGFLNALIHFIIDAFSAFIQILGMAANTVINIVANGLRVLGVVIGHPGDPAAQAYVAQYRLALMQYENNPYIGNDVKAVLNCTKPLREVKGLIPSLRPEDADKTICQVEDSAPQGIVGFMSTIWIVVSRAGDIVVFIVKNFVLINAVIMISLLAYGVAGSIKKRGLDPLFSSLHIIYNIFKFYWSIGVFIFNAGLRFVQAAAQLGSVLIQLGEKIYTAVKTAITVIVEIVKTYIIYSITG
jgi:hypothetical protein